MGQTEEFIAERSRFVNLAARMLGDPSEAEDIAQRAWLRLHTNSAQIDNLPAWLTTVTVRLCLDRLKARTPVPSGQSEGPDTSSDPAEQAVLADSVANALHHVMDRLSPKVRIAFVLHESFGFEFHRIAHILETTPAAARQLASRARSKVGPADAEEQLADWEIVDAFLLAARTGLLDRLIELLAPDVVVVGDAAAVEIGTPSRIEGRASVANFFNGGAAFALPVFVAGRPGAAWFDRGAARVAFDFTIDHGRITWIEFRAEAQLLSVELRRRRNNEVR
ncbi:sigma-70 family RNA polymerase sigma factor [Kocuria sp. cx-455]|uniref:sigma-70 family RNA polymerase sigma factor n=1 Tax=Kocuria sp. cx-455 TaxID=2771377 RepID=UPI001682E113|nr:sigma-70 family RNA polymerase sigma factor [Kocuria sp. cx-455]MBD2765425.1 sigma-70 family RNA polymerase sigma factor [Kocuria sp. cx-455]